MAIAVQAKPLDLTSEMRTFIGRHMRRLRFFGQWDKLKADRSKEA
jgi:hypothetical protein